ncbi:hypothetical protein MMC25_002947 [Agyrium rufum]|nr:hypothetical protein [Agyrium rufum]
MEEESEEEYVPSRDASEETTGSQDIIDTSLSSSDDEFGLHNHRKSSRKSAASRSRANSALSFSENRLNVDVYVGILNEDIRRAAQRNNDYEAGSYRPYETTQHGIVIWTGLEKQYFFNALDRLGKDDIRRISEAVGSKSEPEVRDFIQTLDEAVRDRHLNFDHHNLLGLAEIPAAVEVGQELNDALKEVAGNLAERQFKAEEKAEKGRWGKWWRMSRSDVPPVDLRKMRGRNRNQGHQSAGEEKGEGEGREGGGVEDDLFGALPDQLHKATDLLRADALLDLSERIFMNSVTQSKDWRSYSVEQGPPSIFATALVDFHTLVVSVTERLLQTVLFCAKSRRRARSSYKFTPRKLIRAEDVQAAVNILGMKPDAAEFWAKAARRNNLNVVDVVSSPEESEEDVEEVSLNYDTVEQVLMDAAGYDFISKPREDVVETPRTEFLVTALPAQIDGESLVVGSQETQSDEEYEGYQSESTDYTELVDAHASRAEERRLWSLLQSGRAISSHEPTMMRPGTIGVKRKRKDEVEDWRNWVAYRSEWERYPSPTVFEKAKYVRRKRRRGGLRRSVSVSSWGSGLHASGTTVASSRDDGDRGLDDGEEPSEADDDTTEQREEHNEADDEELTRGSLGHGETDGNSFDYRDDAEDLEGGNVSESLGPRSDSLDNG